MTIHAPYNFVSLSRFIYEPDWAGRISHDVPFSDGVSGEFDIEITAHSKILVGGGRGRENGIQTVEPFKLPDGTYAIPESSLRGMIRNVLEIAAFGRMQFVDDKRFSIRDLTDAARPYYRARIVNKFKTGWLWFDGAAARRGEAGWRITQCSMARVPFDELGAIASAAGIKASILWDKKADAPERYGKWARDKTAQTLSIDDDGRGKKLARLPRGGESGSEGHLVFTGNTGAMKNAKKAEFFFYDASSDAKALPVQQAVFDDFKAIHDPDDGRAENPSWIYWHDIWKRNPATTRIPVFYIIEDDEVASLGLAMMFKLAHELSVAQLIGNTNQQHRRLDSKHAQNDSAGQAPSRDGGNQDSQDIMDLATAIFGCAADDGGSSLGGLKSRVHLGLAKCITSNVTVHREKPTILAGPKPSYFPSYVDQPVRRNGSSVLKAVAKDGAEIYATYTRLAEEEAAELTNPQIRGWKRYPAGREDEIVDVPASNKNKDVQVILKPLKAEAQLQFKSRVRFHNLRPVELGALLWVLEWGGTRGLYHRIGMGKAYGYGQISIAVSEGDWTAKLRPNDGTKPLLKLAYVAAFTKEMDREYSKAHIGESQTGQKPACWEKSQQLLQLLAMANRDVGREKTLEHMQLKAFVVAKNDHETLPDYLAKPVAPNYSGFDIDDIVTYIEGQIEVRIIGIDKGRATVEDLGTGEIIEEVELRLLVKTKAQDRANWRR